MTYDQNTLAQTGVFVTTAPQSGGGVWQSGAAPAIDSAGNVYYLTGNGTGQDYDGVNNFQESLLKFSFANGALKLSGWYTTDSWSIYDDYDLDVTCNGPLLIPGTNLIAFGNKVALTTVLSTKKLGKLTKNNSQVVQFIQTGPTPNFEGNDGDRIIGLVYWQRSTNPLMFVWPGLSVLTSYTFNGAQFSQNQQLSAELYGEPSAAMSLSANGATAGTGILWAVHNTGPGRDIGQPAVLEAYDADNLNDMLWTSGTNPARDNLGSSGRFVIPLVDNARVYMATANGSLLVYGLLGTPKFTAVDMDSPGNVWALAYPLTPNNGLGGQGYSYAANLLGGSITWNGLAFTLGGALAPSGASATTIPLPMGNYSSLSFLGTGINGSQPNQVFTVTYTDGTSTTFTQSLSDWGVPQSFPGESIAASMAYRTTPTAGTTQPGPWNLYGYTMTLNDSKTVQSLVLPSNGNVIVVAATLASTPAAAER